MGQVYAVTERVLDASPERVFDVLADYQSSRGAILPAQFSEYEVREGGKGAGTVVHWKLQATEKRVRDCLFTVTEPSPGQLVETDANSSMVVTWTVTPAGEGKAKVVVETTDVLFVRILRRSVFAEGTLPDCRPRVLRSARDVVRPVFRGMRHSPETLP